MDISYRFGRIWTSTSAIPRSLGISDLQAGDRYWVDRLSLWYVYDGITWNGTTGPPPAHLAGEIDLSPLSKWLGPPRDATCGFTVGTWQGIIVHDSEYIPEGVVYYSADGHLWALDAAGRHISLTYAADAPLEISIGGNLGRAMSKLTPHATPFAERLTPYRGPEL